MNKDKEFMDSPFAAKIKWLKDDIGGIYDPDYGVILRVALMHQFGRGKMKDLVSLLGGRDFITRDYKEEIAKRTQGVSNFINQYSFFSFILALKSAGFISSRLINLQMTLDFAYTLYLLLDHFRFLY